MSTGGENGGEAAPGGRGAAGRVRLIPANPTWEFRLVVASCVVGAGLLVVGIWSEFAVALDGILSTTFIVSGLALIFAGFGAQATVQYKGWVVAGVAATALIFLFAIDYLRRDSYVIVDLMTPKKPPPSFRTGDANMSGAPEFEGDLLRTRFFIRYRKLDEGNLSFYAQWPRDDPTQSPFVLVCFTRDKLVHWFGRGRQLKWWLSDDEKRIVDVDNRVVATSSACAPGQGGSAGLPTFAIGPALAQGAPRTDALIQDLLSDTAEVRRLARDQLAEIGPSTIRPLMDRAIAMTAANDRLAVRMQIGAAVVIDTMLSVGTKKYSPADVRRQLRPADYNAIIQWTLNRDQSLLGPSLRILANTADLAVLRALMEAVDDQTNENIIYNTAWILRQSAQRFRNDPSTLSAIKQLARTLRPRARGEKTLSFLNQIDAM
jgi:hypothetical protein